MNKSVFMVAAALAGSLQIVTAADVTGKVTLKGTPPPEKTIEMDATCGKLHSGPVTTRHFVVSKDGGLANVYVYVSKGLEGKKFDAPAQGVTLDQTGCMYEPYVSGIMVNQPLKIRNSDTFGHNVHALPRPDSGNKEFNFAQPTQGQVNEKSFATKEVLLKLKCDMHNWMFAYVGVMDHPFFAVTDKDGNFKISNLPAGEYTLTAYHLKSHGATAGVSQTIKVGDAPVTADFTVEVPAAK
jgi:hypothetical protein